MLVDNYDVLYVSLFGNFRWCRLQHQQCYRAHVLTQFYTSYTSFQFVSQPNFKNWY